MTQTLSSLFQKSKGKPIDVDGFNVQPIYKLNIKSSPQKFLIHRMKADVAYPSGLHIKCVKGEIEVNGQYHTEIILWSDTSPDAVPITVIAKAGCELKIWNIWKVDDLVQAWVGNAGILVKQNGAVTTLECSNGIGDVDFSNLVIQIEQL